MFPIPRFSNLLLVLFLMAACGTPYRDTTAPITAQADFDPVRYTGTWFEIARFPVPFERGCTATTATYEILNDSLLSVVNTCRAETPEGPLRRIEGTAEIVAPGRLRVRFATVPFIRAPYWVLWVDDTYETAVVGVPNGRAGWILARQSQISAAKRQKAEEVLLANGYDPSRLLKVRH
jgi:apolipoprotein D and lipocalin family protein